MFYFPEEPSKIDTADKLPGTIDTGTTEVLPSSTDIIEESTPESSDSVDAAAKFEGSVDKEDDLARELEEIEGSKKEDNTQTDKIESCPATQKTSDLIKDLESDASSTETAASKINEGASETVASTPKLIDEEVDSTTENLLKRKHSEDNAIDGNVAKKLNMAELEDLKQPQMKSELPTNSKTVDENVAPSEEPSAMEVDDPNDADEDKVDDVTCNVGQKEEAITSTSSEVVCTVTSVAKTSDPEIVEKANAPNASVSGSAEDEIKPRDANVADTKAIELPEEPVSSTEDLSPSEDAVATEDIQTIVDKEAVSSKVEDVNATVASVKTAASIATTKDKESLESSTTQEVQMSDSTISMNSAASEAIRKELRTARSDATNKMDVDLNASSVSANTTNGDGNKKPENKLLTNMMNNGGSSTPNSYPASPATIGGGSNVFNSTPIQKQFEVKSENVSKIDEHSKTNVTTDATPEVSKTSDALTSTGMFTICVGDV